MVEDDYHVRKLIVGTLRKHGYNILEAGDGRQVLELFEQHPEEIHLVLTDVIVPNMGGNELVNHLRKIQPDLAYILFWAAWATPFLSMRNWLKDQNSFKNHYRC